MVHGPKNVENQCFKMNYDRNIDLAWKSIFTIMLFRHSEILNDLAKVRVVDMTVKKLD